MAEIELSSRAGAPRRTGSPPALNVRAGPAGAGHRTHVISEVACRDVVYEWVRDPAEGLTIPRTLLRLPGPASLAQ